MEGIKAKPFLRWAGGKKWLLKDLTTYLPKKYNHYHEPFLGGGAVFYYLNPENKVFLSDTNKELINAYIQVRDNVEKLISILEKFVNTEDEYYKIRSTIFENNISKAAQFIYFNRTGFNGIYRVNQQGRYNVPYGFKKYKSLADYQVLRIASQYLKGSEILATDFSTCISNINEGDLVFLDPPYTILHGKNGFIEYNERLFSWEDQKRLAIFIKKLISKGAYYILTNAEHESIKELYCDVSEPLVIERYSGIGGKKAKRGRYQEYMFTNSR